MNYVYVIAVIIHYACALRIYLLEQTRKIVMTGTKRGAMQKEKITAKQN